MKSTEKSISGVRLVCMPSKTAMGGTAPQKETPMRKSLDGRDLKVAFVNCIMRKEKEDEQREAD